MITIKDTKPQDLIVLADHMRQADIDEIKKLGGDSPLEAVLLSWRNSIICSSVFDDNTLIMIYGVSHENYLSGRANVWALSTESIQKTNKVSFAKKSRAVVKGLLERFDSLYFVADKEHIINNRWVKFLGANLVKENNVSIVGVLGG